LDHNVIKKENLHRTLGATRAMIGVNKVAALAPVTRDIATADRLRAHRGLGDHGSGLTSLKD